MNPFIHSYFLRKSSSTSIISWCVTLAITNIKFSLGPVVVPSSNFLHARISTLTAYNQFPYWDKNLIEEHTMGLWLCTVAHLTAFSRRRLGVQSLSIGKRTEKTRWIWMFGDSSERLIGWMLSSRLVSRSHLAHRLLEMMVTRELFTSKSISGTVKTIVISASSLPLLSYSCNWEHSELEKASMVK